MSMVLAPDKKAIDEAAKAKATAASDGDAPPVEEAPVDDTELAFAAAAHLPDDPHTDDTDPDSDGETDTAADDLADADQPAS
jgi:hypothetical protein